MSGSAGFYRLAPLAEADLEGIWRYTSENWSNEQADKYHGDIVSAFEGLAMGIRKGRPVDVRDGYFKYAVGSHFVYYCFSDSTIDVMRVLHQRMDVSRHLESTESRAKR